MQLRRSQLFVPGNDERKIVKALGLASCDSVIFDLEDAVPPSEKENARRILKRIITETKVNVKRLELCVRINPSGSPYSKQDLSEFKDFEMISAMVVPKAEPAFVSEIHKILPNKKLMPLIETARGFLRAEEIASMEGVSAISYGPADFANSVGGNVEAYMKSAYLKTHIAVVAGACGVEPIDSVFFALNDIEGFREEARFARDLGFVGKQAIHPTQVEAANEIFSPSPEDVKMAKKIVESYELAESRKVGAIRLDEQLVDAVHYRRARQLLERREMIDGATSL